MDWAAYYDFATPTLVRFAEIQPDEAIVATLSQQWIRSHVAIFPMCSTQDAYTHLARRNA